MADTENFPRQYVVTFDYGDGPGMALCTADRMRKAVEDATYSGEHDDARYYTLIAGEMVEVTFRCIRAGEFDEDDYSDLLYRVFPKAGGDDAIDTFGVRIDGRA